MTNTTISDFALKKRVGIIGGNLPDAISLKNAERMGELIAKNGYILVNGGMKGVMEASARGAKSVNGLVIGILPGKARDDSNSYVDIAIPTGLGYMRNPLVVLNSDILVAIDGSHGTLSEIAYTQIYNPCRYASACSLVSRVLLLNRPRKRCQCSSN